MKYIKWIILLAVCIALTVLCIRRWDAWFYEPIEPDFQAINAPGRIQLTFGNTGQFSRNISWQYGDNLLPSKVLLTKKASADTTYIPASGRIFETTGGVTVIYHAELGDLLPGVYFYSVISCTKQSDWYSFTVGEQTNYFTFVYLGDIQDTIGGYIATGQFFRNVREQVQDASFWLLGGDVIERPHDQYWNEYFMSMYSISPSIPIVAAPGNHEYSKGIIRRIDERFVHTFSYLVESRHRGNNVFRTTYGNMAIITLDTTQGLSLLSQRRWFRRALQESQDKKWIVVAFHHPVHSIRRKTNNLQIRLLFNPLIRRHGVDLVLQGHDHVYARKITTQNGNLTTPIYLIGQASPKDYRINFATNHDRFGAGLRFFHRITVAGDTLSMKTFTEHNELYDHIYIIKTDSDIQVIDKAQDFPEIIEINARTRGVRDKARRASYEEDILRRLKQ